MKQLANLDKKAKKYNIDFILETDLPPKQNVSLMKSMIGMSVGMNFDMGNSAYWSFNPDIELPQLGPWIKMLCKRLYSRNLHSALGDGNVTGRKH